MVAQFEARIWRHQRVGTEHLLEGLAARETGIAAGVLRSHVNLRAIHGRIRRYSDRNFSMSGWQKTAGSDLSSVKELPFSEDAKKAFIAAWELSAERMEMITTAHLLAGLCSVPHSAACMMLAELNCDVEHLRELALQRVQLVENMPEQFKPFSLMVKEFFGIVQPDPPEPTKLPAHWVKPTLNLLAAKHIESGDFARAENLLSQALQITIGANSGGLVQASTLRQLGTISLERGNLAQAEEQLRQSLDHHKRYTGEDSDPEQLTFVLIDLARSLHWQGKFAEAKNYYSQALEQLRRLGRPRTVAFVYDCLGDTFRSLGDSEMAKSVLLRDDGADQGLSREGKMHRYFYRARLLRDMGMSPAAEHNFREAFEAAVSLRDSFVKYALVDEFSRHLEASGRGEDAIRVRQSVKAQREF